MKKWFTLLILFSSNFLLGEEVERPLLPEIRNLEGSLERNFGVSFSPVRGLNDEAYLSFLGDFQRQAQADNLGRRFIPRSHELSIDNSHTPQTMLEEIRNHFPQNCTNEARELSLRERLHSRAIIEQLWWFRDRGITFESQDMSLRRVTPHFNDMEDLLKAYLQARHLIESEQFSGRSIVLKRPQEPVNPHLENNQALVLQLGNEVSPNVLSQYQAIMNPEREPQGLLLGCDDQELHPELFTDSLLGESLENREDLQGTCELIRERSLEMMRMQTRQVLEVIRLEEDRLQRNFSDSDEVTLLGCRGQAERFVWDRNDQSLIEPSGTRGQEISGGSLSR